MKFTKTINLLILSVFILINICPIFAQTEVSGNITTDTTWTKVNSPYIVTGTVNVYPGATLTIELGVVLRLNSEISIQIGGELIARGTEIDSIYFIQNVEGDRWGTIKFIDSSIDAVYDDEGNYINGSIIEYAKIEGAGNSGIYCDRASPFIYKNTISRNKAYYGGYGGGIHCNNSSPKISGNEISCNNGSWNGGGIGCIGSKSIPIISGNIIIDNTLIDSTSSVGGGIYCADSSPIISENLITDNLAGSGGGIGIFFYYGSLPLISENLIINNKAGNFGGGIDCNNSSDKVIKNIIKGNIIKNNTAGYYGGGINCLCSSPTISENTISDNLADSGGGIHCGGTYFIGSSPIITRNIILGNTSDGGGGGIYSDGYSNPKINYNNIHNNQLYNIYLVGMVKVNVNATYNWWGTSDKDSIDTHIPFYYCRFDYEPFLTSATPIKIYSITLKTDNIYSTNLITLSILDTLYIELNGTDGDSSHQDTTIAYVINENNTDSIFVKLIETSLNTGIYRGISYFSEQTDNELKILGAEKGDNIKIVSVVDTSICNSVIVSETTSIELLSQKIPNEYKLFQNYPNPFNPETNIKYEIPKTTNVEIAVYNILGQKIKTILNEVKNPGVYKILWDGTNERDINVSSGVYLYVIKAKGFFVLRKMILIR